MQFITTGNRIAVENFTLGDLYTITFTNGTYINSACIGIGENFVSFQRNEPELIFSLTMETAELVSSIDLYAGGTGTNNYNDLTNKPQIDDVELVGNKSLNDLGIQATISDLDTIRSGAAAGATAVQPAALADYQPKIDSSHKLDADLVDDTSSTHKFATAAQLSQIGINENNILLTQKNNVINTLPFPENLTSTDANITFNVNNDGTIDVTIAAQVTTNQYIRYDIDVSDGDYIFSCGENSGTGTNSPYDAYIFDTSTGTAVIRDNSLSPTDRAHINTGAYRLDIRIRPACPTGTIRFRPMLRAQSISDSTYQPPAKSNVWLYNAIRDIQARLANG